ncbi:SDR family NAD(P)-dependent oxidoreductase [Dermatobacter hominis]|uniref:SDR family NAD(P)-dependent oxidoreductase n=1 Tax=Dermatobacter hominis TaxID=2884263 RepID=UPI001D11BB51|nr:SDR family oxidoreductase [Dermatobacter hominis]UDY35330.1 SDR family oxidoreductase [Dermatobacter hominis]
MNAPPAPLPTPDDARLDGRVVVVTGAANGIGRATALTAARFGARLAVCDRDADGLATLVDRLTCDDLVGGPEDVHAAVLDVRDVDAVQAFAAEVGERFGAVHGVVNNAGGTYRAAFADSSSKGDRSLVDENFTSVVAVTRAILELMGEGGSVVNVTSSEAFQAAPGFAVYAAMKAGVENLTKTLALELGDRGIRVNSVSPDGIPTWGDEALAASVRETSPFLPPPVPPIGRFAPPEECASVIAFLLGDLSRFVTGTGIHVDGGLHAAGGWHRRPT